MKGYKLLKQRKDGSLGPLFINASQRIPLNEWLPAESHRTKGYAYRPGWHCCVAPDAPHLSMELASGERRRWCHVELRDVEILERPRSQGGRWLLAQHMKVVGFV